MKKFTPIYSLLFFVFLNIQQSISQTSWKGVTSTNWNVASNWTNGIPDSTKDAVLGDANFTGINQPIVNVNSYCKSIRIGGTVATSLRINRALLVINNLNTLNNGTIIQGNAIITMRGNWINDGSYTISHANAKIVLSGSAQSIGGSVVTNFNRLAVNASCTLTLNSNVNVTGSGSHLFVYGLIDPGQSPTYKITSTVNTRLYDLGKILVKAPTFTENYTLTGATTLFGGSIVEYCSTVSDQVVSSAYSYSTLIISGTGTKSLVANLPLLYSSGINKGNIYVNSGTFDIGIYTANRKPNITGGELHVANGAFLKVAGTNNFPLNFNTYSLALTSTVNYNGLGDQTISVKPYGNLLLSGSGNKNAYVNLTILGHLQINSGTLNTSSFTVTHSIAGDFIMTGGSITGVNSTYRTMGVSDQQIALTTSIPKLSIDKPSGKLVAGTDITVSNTLNFIKGNIQTAANTVIMPQNALISGASGGTGWVDGNLQKHVATGVALSRTFEIGDAAFYLPATFVFAAVSVAGNIKAALNSTDHSELDYSSIDPAKSVNIFWSISNIGTVFTTAVATFNWTGSNVDALANTANFKSALFNTAAWIQPTVGSTSSTSIEVAGLTQLGEFAVGEGISKYTWNGNALTADWFTPKNWLGGVPTTGLNTVIPAGITGGRLYPILTGGIGTVDSITVEAASSLTVNAGTLQVAGLFTSTGLTNVSSGTVEFNGSMPQVISADLFVNNTIKDLVINSDVSLAGTDSITGTLSIMNGKTLTTNDNLVLKSTANGTARIAPLPVNGSGDATAFITGNVSIERYIPARKAWRLLSAPIKPGATTINAAWQEGVNGSSFGPNPNPGYGVHITGGSILNGFDQSPTNTASLKIFNSTTNTYVGLPAVPGTNVPLSNYPGYFLYVRGDRSIDLMQGNNAAITPVTLRVRGEINTGNKTVSVNAANFSVIGNPYASAIDFQTLTRTNVKNSFYIWDPKLAGTNGLGAYVTVSWNTSTSSYDVTTAASPISQYIPSGEAILVESQDGINPGSVTFKETDKTVNGSDMLFGRGNTKGQKIRVDLYSGSSSEPASLLDGTLATYDENHFNKADAHDVKKMFSGSENIALQRAGKIFAIERKQTITNDDTLFIHLSKMKPQSYQMQIKAANMNEPGMAAYLLDNYSEAVNKSELSLDGVNTINFTVTDDPSSFAEDRFKIVFIKEVVTPAPTITQQRNGNKVFNNIAKVSFTNIEMPGAIAVFPNPVTGNSFSLELSNIPKGQYNILISTVNGQTIKKISLEHTGETRICTVPLDSNLPAGKYQVQLMGEGVNSSASIIKE